MKKKILAGLFLLANATTIFAQTAPPAYNANSRFEQLGSALPTPNTYRTASGAPGRDYWQIKVDYDIKAELNDENQSMTGTEKITFTNNSPDEIRYVWVQLDQNNFQKGADGTTSTTGGIDPSVSASRLKYNTGVGNTTDYGYKISAVKDGLGKDLKYLINQTMMRVDLPAVLRSGQATVLQIDWKFNIVDANATRARSGYELFPKDKNYVYEIAQWFPRLAVYDDVNGWQQKQFLGQGEFTLPFGDYKVALTVPNDHLVGATGELQNASQVMTATQLKRMEQAKKATDKPVIIATQDEAVKAETGKPTGKKTWIYSAKNVRDFAFATSRKFIWDAMSVDVEGKKTMAMSFYPKEANPLWGQYSTRLVAHTLKSYSARSIAYPYPVAQSIHGPVGGMEYPMICFNGARPQEDGTYSEGTKNFLISVVIHEVGHNFFPMIVNSDERQWSWMDEGLNSFLEGLASLEWDRDFPADGINPADITSYMKTDAKLQVPIMASSDNILPNTFGPNAYSKPATGLNILRETIMGREAFDYAFKEYARRWAFKSPMPADFFRTMEDASGVDLDWFWKGWFYGVEPVDQDLVSVDWFAIDSQDPTQQKAEQKSDANAKKETMSAIRNRTDIKQTVVEADSTMKDFYNTYDKFATTEADKKKYDAYVAGLSEDDRKLVGGKNNFYVLSLKNKGGLPMPVIVKLDYEDGTNEIVRIPAEIWRFNDKEIKKTIPTTKKVAKFTLDPFYEIADIDTSNNAFPKEPEKPTKFQVFKQQQRGGGPNPMQQQRNSQTAIGGAKN